MRVSIGSVEMWSVRLENVVNDWMGVGIFCLVCLYSESGRGQYSVFVRFSSESGSVSTVDCGM